MELKAEWNNVEKATKQVVKVFEPWLKANMTITHGTGRTLEDVFGLPYTSSSDFAAIWNCQGEATLNENPEWRFEGLALTEDNDVVVICEHEDGTAETLDRKYIVIGKAE